MAMVYHAFMRQALQDRFEEAKCYLRHSSLCIILMIFDSTSESANRNCLISHSVRTVKSREGVCLGCCPENPLAIRA